MAKQKTLTHNYEKDIFKTPYKRVKYYNGFDFEIVGENVLNTGVIDTQLDEKQLKELAKEMFLSWENPIYIIRI